MGFRYAHVSSLARRRSLSVVQMHGKLRLSTACGMGCEMAPLMALIPHWLERLAWRALHRHLWADIGLLTEGVWPHAIVRQACRVHGCGSRRIVYDDGGRVPWRARRKLLANWPGRAVRPDPVDFLQASLAKCNRLPVEPAPPTMRSAAIRRLESAVDRVKSTVRRLPDE
jgi:hypothetical protein